MTNIYKKLKLEEGILKNNFDQKKQNLHID